MGRSKWAVVVAACALVVAAVAVAYAAGKAKAGPVAEVVRARRFEIVDAKGQTRIRLDAQDGEAQVTLLDGKGAPQAFIAAKDGADPRLSLRSSTGQDRVSMYFVYGEPQLTVGQESRYRFARVLPLGLSVLSEHDSGPVTADTVHLLSPQGGFVAHGAGWGPA